jgi:CheY-like chemotaxis protein
MPLVILVDDEEEFLEIASLKLQGSGFETFTTNNGHEAVAKAEELKPALVLSDVYMAPGPSGWEVALELHRNPKTRGVKLAFFTSLREPWTEIPLAERAAVLAELGNVTFLSKIDDVEALGERVTQLIA